MEDVDGAGLVSADMNHCNPPFFNSLRRSWAADRRSDRRLSRLGRERAACGRRDGQKGDPGGMPDSRADAPRRGCQAKNAGRDKKVACPRPPRQEARGSLLAGRDMRRSTGFRGPGVAFEPSARVGPAPRRVAGKTVTSIVAFHAAAQARAQPAGRYLSAAYPVRPALAGWGRPNRSCVRGRHQLGIPSSTGVASPRRGGRQTPVRRVPGVGGPVGQATRSSTTKARPTARSALSTWPMWERWSGFRSFRTAVSLMSRRLASSTLVMSCTRIAV